jgi:hypothetical protein
MNKCIICVEIIISTKLQYILCYIAEVQWTVLQFHQRCLAIHNFDKSEWEFSKKHLENLLGTLCCTKCYVAQNVMLNKMLFSTACYVAQNVMFHKIIMLTLHFE